MHALRQARTLQRRKAHCAYGDAKLIDLLQTLTDCPKAHSASSMTGARRSTRGSILGLSAMCAPSVASGCFWHAKTKQWRARAGRGLGFGLMRPRPGRPFVFSSAGLQDRTRSTVHAHEEPVASASALPGAATAEAKEHFGTHCTRRPPPEFPFSLRPRSDQVWRALSRKSVFDSILRI
jgi:hypothetical protein